jgi:hypothetical protein
MSQSVQNNKKTPSLTNTNSTNLETVKNSTNMNNLFSLKSNKKNNFNYKNNTPQNNVKPIEEPEIFSNKTVNNKPVNNKPVNNKPVNNVGPVNNSNKSVNKQAETTKGMFTSAANKITDYYESATGNETLMTVFKVTLGIILLIIIINIVKYFYIKWINDKSNNPMLIQGTKNGKQAMVISQDPNHTNYVPINRSVNKEGIEFTYSSWFVISDLTYKQGEWKHVFHKGNSTSYPNRAPGVWIHPTNNTIRIYMNTMKEILEYVDIDNIPLRKWVHMAIVVKNRTLSIYINGFLKISKELSSLPRQNYGNVWVNLFGGFDGYVSQLQYFDHALKSEDVQEAVMKGPSQGACIDTKERPPYLDDSWWLN